ncbi:HNH endonuclease [Nocardia jiangxiensis]|uniref:HNH endonuclease n=1 Tax=Nocardia jiangxiensis TaxID=282685 RepID=UPI0002D44AE9|nr:HNH endonuclease [Nocardia jiangxiensis]
MSAPELKTAEWKNLCRRLKATLAPVCHICGAEIDLSLPGTAKWGWTADHVQPRHLAPHRIYDPSNIRPAHRDCNEKRGGHYEQNVNISRKWG